MDLETVEVPDNSTITFTCEEVVVKDKSLETKWGAGVPLNFEDYDTLIFSGKGKTFTYKKV